MQHPFPSKTKLLLRHLYTLQPPTTTATNKRAAEQRCLSLLELCNSLTKLTQLHADILKLGLQTNPLVLTKFTSTASHLHVISYASSFLFAPTAQIHLYDSFLFNTLIRSYAQNIDKISKHNAIYYYNLMGKLCISPNKFTYPFVLKACAGIGNLRIGQTIHGLVLKHRFGDDSHVLNTMVHMYCSCEGGIQFGRKVFDDMPKRDSIAWSAMIGGYTKSGMGSDAVELFRKMQISGIKPDSITMVSVLSACSDIGALQLGRWVESYIEKEKVPKSTELCNALIDMFAKCGDVDKALKLFKNMGNNNIVAWTCVINGMAMHGRGLDAINLFEEMKKSGIVPDSVAFIGLLSACSHSGLVHEGKRYFTSMTKDFGILPKIEHYGCMVDMLSRAGLVKDALAFVHTMPMEPNPIIWRTLITSCRAHGEFTLSEEITQRLIKIEPMHDSNYILLSNIYAKMSRWDKKSMIRERMEKKGVKKIPGSTMIELDNEIYEFVSGDKSQVQYKEIYKMVDEIRKKIKKNGYVAETSEVLLDINEEDKEDVLNTHSEKLAIAFALLKTSPGTCIRIVKNLRVCTDCHSATKFISKIYGREIVVRDRNRFHHFKDGLCSCNDFW